jgi:hypothetical protein
MFILLAITTVFAYLVYTCCRSRNSRQHRNGALWKSIPGIGDDGRLARMGDKVSNVSKKVKLGGICTRRAVLDLKGFGFSHGRRQSKSEVNRKFTWPRIDILMAFA